MTAAPLHAPLHPVRFVTAASLFDGHVAAINIMRRILQSRGAEVVHLGHNRSVREVVAAAVQEDVQCIALSAYQGGHVEYFEYLVELLREAGAGHVQVVGGGGGVIVPAEISRLREAGVTIFSPEDGQRLGLPGMVNQVVAACDRDLWEEQPTTVAAVLTGERAAVARAITAAETGHLTDELRSELERAAAADPRDHDDLLRAFLLDKALYEVVYEARNRPTWLAIPVAAITRLLDRSPENDEERGPNA